MARLSFEIDFVFFVMNFDMASLKGSFSLLSVLLKSPSVKIPFRDLLSITRATPRPLELISIRVLDSVVFGFTLGRFFP